MKKIVIGVILSMFLSSIDLFTQVTVDFFEYLGQAVRGFFSDHGSAFGR